jgi:ABC-2 type transport system permease protein
MFGPLFGFELRSHFRRPVTWLYVAIVFFMAFSAVSTESFVSGQMLGKVKKNSPYSLAQLYGILLAIGQIMTIALVGTTVLRDYDAGVHEILFSTRISRAAYLGAKYLGALLAMLLVFAALPLGALVGTVMPWVDADTLQRVAALALCAAVPPHWCARRVLPECHAVRGGLPHPQQLLGVRSRHPAARGLLGRR